MKSRKMIFLCANLLLSMLLVVGVTGCGYGNEKPDAVVSDAEVFDDAQQSDLVEDVSEEKEDKSSDYKTEPKLEELNIIVNPTKTGYFVDETLETEGMMLEAVYSDGSRSVIEDGFRCFPTELTQAGSYEIAVFYEGLTTEFTVKVEEPVKVTDIAIVDLPYTTTYMVGQQLDQNGLALEVKYSDGNREVIRQEFQCTPEVLTEAGSQDIVLSYEGEDVTFEVNVLDRFVFDNMVVECVSVGNDKYSGVNANGQLINWCLIIQFDLSDDIRNVFRPAIIDCSWGHVVNGDGFEYEVDFEDANNGVTYSEFGTISGEYTESGNAIYMSMIHLPDEPSIAGEQSVTIQVGNVKKVFSFDLTYEGDYENGTGWSVNNIRY